MPFPLNFLDLNWIQQAGSASFLVQFPERYVEGDTLPLIIGPRFGVIVRQVEVPEEPVPPP